MAVSRCLIDFIVFAILFVVYIIGFSVDYWSNNKRGHFGLWNIGSDLPDDIKATQAMMCLGLICHLAVLVGHIINLAKTPEQLIDTVRKVIPILSISGGILGVIGCIVFWAYIDIAFIADGFGLIFCFISSVVFIAQVVFLLVRGTPTD